LNNTNALNKVTPCSFRQRGLRYPCQTWFSWSASAR